MTERICNRCGYPASDHGLDQYTLEPTICPVYRQEDRTMPGGGY